MNEKKKFPFFAREGRVHIAAALILAVFMQVAFGFAWAFPFWVLAVFVLQFFRDPVRIIAPGENKVVCPAHGKVVYTGIVDDPYLERQALKISIFMNVFSVHSNFSPCTGLIKKIDYYQGKFVNAALDKASTKNERNVIILTTDAGQDVVFIQIAGLIARRIICHVNEDERLERGDRYGFIRFGSKVDVYLPETTRPLVSIGDSVMSGNDIIAELQPNV